MSRLVFACAACGCLMVAAAASGRPWADSTGNYRIEADLIAYDDGLVVLKKPDHDLVAVPVDKLSEKDREFLRSKEAEDHVGRSQEKMQTWTLRSGLKLNGRVVDYVRRDVTIQRRRGRIYVNDRVLRNLPEVYRGMMPTIVSHFEKTDIPDNRRLESWVLGLRGEPRTYAVEGVVVELENGDEYGIPFFLFSEDDLKVLQPGWELWLAAAKTPEKSDEDRCGFLLEAAAQAYQQDQSANKQIAMMQLLLQAVDAGVTSLWEVQLLPKPGFLGLPLSVIVPGRDSRAATMEALSRNPGYVAGPVRRVSNR